MPGTRDIKRRIKSVQSTQKITKAMEMVAAAKLRKLQGKVDESRPYAAGLMQTMARLVPKVEGFSHPLLEVRPRKKVLYVVLAGDRGLCGGYNQNILRLSHETIKNEAAETEVVVVGRKAREYFQRRGVALKNAYLDVGDEPDYIQSRAMINELAQFYIAEEADEVRLAYTVFHSAVNQEPTVVTLLPFTNLAGVGEDLPGGQEYIYEPSAEAVLSQLLPRYLETVFFQTLMEAKTSEHAARMRAMGAASDNAADLIDSLTLHYNRARQAAITREITEIVGGAEALKG